jgi:hypothetical protein
MNFAIMHDNKLFYQHVGTVDHHCPLDNAGANILISNVDMHRKAFSASTAEER